MTKKINKILGIIAIIFVIGMVTVGFYKRHLLLDNFAFASGKVTEITSPGWKSSGDYSVLYEYWIGGKLYRNNSNYSYCGHLGMVKLRALLVGKSFPVVYATKDAGTGTLLLTQENADRFHYQLPGSLKSYDSVLTCKQ